MACVDGQFVDVLGCFVLYFVCRGLGFRLNSSWFCFFGRFAVFCCCFLLFLFCFVCCCFLLFFFWGGGGGWGGVSDFSWLYFFLFHEKVIIMQVEICSMEAKTVTEDFQFCIYVSVQRIYFLHSLLGIVGFILRRKKKNC